MRSFLLCAVVVSALSTSVQAAEPAGQVSLQSREGQAIARKVADISYRVGLPNPLVAQPIEPAYSGAAPKFISDSWAKGFQLDRASTQASRREGVSLIEVPRTDLAARAERDTLGWPTRLRAGPRNKLIADRAKLLARLDLDAETRARIEVD